MDVRELISAACPEAAQRRDNERVTQPATASSKRLLLFAALLCLAPVIVFYAMLWHAARPVPMFDDYHAILLFLLRMRALPGPGARLLYLVAAQHDEYKLVVEHAVVAVDWALTGQVHFGFLNLLGNLLVLPTAWLLWSNMQIGDESKARRLLRFAPVCYLLFQLNYVENLNWAMCSLQTMPVIFFTLASLHCVFRRNQPAMMALACLCAALASLSSANGFLVAPIGFVVLVWRREWGKTAAWVVSIAVALSLYLYRYQRFVAPPTETRTGPGYKLLFLLSFLGGAAENMHHFPWKNASILVGLALLASFAIASRTRFPQVRPTLYCMALWCLLSAAVVTQRRIIYGLNLSLTERYKIYSDLVLIVAYQFWISRSHAQSWQRRRMRWAFAAVVAVAMLFCGISDLFGYRYLMRRQQRVAEGLNEYVANPAKNPPEISIMGEPFAGLEPEFTREVLTESLRVGIYTLPPVSER